MIGMVLQNDYPAFFDSEIEERRQFKYPPFFRMIRLHMKHKNAGYLDEAAAALAPLLKSRLGNRVLGQEITPVHRIRKHYIDRKSIESRKGVSDRDDLGDSRIKKKKK